MQSRRIVMNKKVINKIINILKCCENCDFSIPEYHGFRCDDINCKNYSNWENKDLEYILKDKDNEIKDEI
jgi:hypothetical protein